ncbi:MAG: DUF1549 and DUF1553 domain-containing protein [Isosphaerales bacterium]
MILRSRHTALAFSGLIAVFTVANARADLPLPSVDAITVQPTEIVLHDSRATQRVLVTGRHRSSLESDLTALATYKSLDPAVATVSPGGVVSPRGRGEVTLVVRYAGHEQRARVRVARYGPEPPVDFRTEVVAALARGGCNQGACHGSPQGKGGFRLSLRGFDPELDHVTLTREAFGRRTDVFDPPASLILKKATLRVPHQGGRRFQKDAAAYKLLNDWISQGCRPSPSATRLTGVEVFPSRRYLHASSPRQQLVVRARFDDASVRDVTDLAVFSSSNEADAPVTARGLVEFRRTAETVILVRYLERIETVPLTYVRTDPNFVAAPPAVVNEIDRHVFDLHRRLQLHAARGVEDPIFLRRAFLDLIGALPTPEEVTRFLDSTDLNKRSKLIDALLERDEFASFWAMKWADIMRGNREAITERGVHNFHRYLVTQFALDRPFDQFAREVLTSRGNTIHTPSANFYRITRTPEDAAESAAQLFMGVRIQCAKCHNHPFEAMTQKDYYGLAAFFARVRLKGQRFGLDDEVVFLAGEGEVTDPTRGKVQAPYAFGKPFDLGDPDDDRRRHLADWLTAGDNRYFARATANRVWAHLMGRGIVEPVDDFRDSNPPSDPDLLGTLAGAFVRCGYRIKPLIRLIMNSATYQRSAEPPAHASPHGADPERYFTSAVVRMLTAEQVLDAISTATGIPERFPGYPPGTRAIEIAEGEIANPFLRAFTKPVRNDACDCARETEPSLNQVIHLVNNADLIAKIESPESRLGLAAKAGKTTAELVELAFLATLSRRPAEQEKTLALEHIARAADRLAGLRDLQHALINSNEFLLRH